MWKKSKLFPKFGKHHILITCRNYSDLTNKETTVSLPAAIAVISIILAVSHFSPAFADTYTFVQQIDGSLVSTPLPLNVPQGLAVDTTGNIFLADTGHNQIVIFNSAGTTASTISTFDGVDTFSSPQDIATTPSGFYVTDQNNNRVVQFDSSGNFIRSFGTSVLSSPIGIATDSAGNVYVVSNNDGVIDKFSSGGSFINSFTTTTGANTFIPNDIAIDPSSGNIYVTDLGNNRVVEFNSAESYVTSFGTLGVGLGQFTGPGGIAIDPAGKILVTDLSNGRIEKFDSSGNLITVFGSFTADSNFSPGQFNLPSDVATDSSGNVYVTDSNFNNISEYHFSPGGSPPAAPMNLAATTISINTISLSWNASPGATSYTIYRSTNPSGPFSTVAGTTTSTSFPDAGLSLSTTYYYEISATSPSGQSGFSNTASAATLSLIHTPSTPINLATSGASTTSISLSWNASPGATSYTIYRSTNPSGPFTTSIGTSTSPSFNNTGLQSATSYYYEVSASNTDGTSGLSNTAAGTTFKTTTTTTLTSSTNPSIVGQSVNFTATVSPSTATGTVQFAVDGSNLGSPVSLSSGTATSIPSTLAVGPHTITAKYSGDANNAASTSNNVSQTVNQIPTTTTLTSSTNPSIVGQSVNFTATVSPTPTTGDMVTFYDGTTSIGTGTTNSAGKATLATSTLSITSHSITAAFGGDSSFTTSTSPPLAQTVNPLSLPTGLNATATSSSTISLSWNASPGATSYTIYRSTNPSGPFTTSIGTSTTTSFTDTGLSPTTTYYYEIAASNTASTSGLSNTTSATTLAIVINSSTCPPAPTVTNIANINSYVIFGTHGVHIESSNVVNCGNVGEEPINDEIHIEENSQLSKSAIVGTNVHIEKNTSVYQAFYSRNLHNEGTAAAAPVKIHTTMISLPPFFSGTDTKGAKDVTINNLQTLPAGSVAYGKIKVNNGATLEFTGGNYTINSLTVGDGVTLKFDRATTLYIKDQLNTGQSVTINPASSHVDAATVLFYVNHQIHLGKSSTVNANMYAQQEIHLEEHTVATGAFIGSSVHVEENSAITYDYGFPQAVSHQDNDQITSTHGQGSVGANTSFNFNVKPGNDKSNSLQGKLQFSDTTKKISLQSVSILTLSLAGNDVVTFTGSATVNNVSGYAFSVTTQDRADNTSYPDVFQITIFDKTGAQIYSNPGPVTQGDVEVETSDNGHSDKDH